MKNFLKKALSGIGLAFMVLAISQPALATLPQAQASEGQTSGSAALNADPKDFAVLAVSNYSRCPGSSSCWGPSVNGVQPGEILSFVIYAHNTGSQPANNTRVSMQLQASGSQMTGRAVLSADNAPAVYDDVQVGFASNVRTPVTLTFVGGEYYNQSSIDPNHPDSFPNGTSARQIAQGGINIGTLQNDYAGQFTKDVQIVVRYRVEGDNGGNTCSSSATLRVTPSSDTIDVDDVASYRAVYDSNGDCAGGETDVTNSATWTIDNSNIATNLDDGRFRGRRDGSTTVRASYNGRSDDATLRVRDNNDDDDDSCDSNETLVIVPYTATFSVGQTYQYRALYDEDGPGCSGGERDVTTSADWSTNSSVVANLDDGRFRGNTGGNATITARYSGINATAQAVVIGNTTIQQPPVVIGGGTITLPPTVIGGGTVITQPVVSGGVVAGIASSSVACITVTPSVDVTSMLPGQDFVYTTLYRNDCPFTLNQAVLRVFIPNDVEFKASSNPFFLREGQKFSYNIGALPPGGQGSVAISGMVRKDARIGDTETFTSSIEFFDGTQIKGTTSYLVAVLGGDIRRTLTASLSDTLGHIFGSGWLWFLIGLLILAGIVWFIVSMIRRRHADHATNTKVVVAPTEDPLRALRNA